MKPVLEWGWYTRWHSIEETDFPSHQQMNANSSELEAGLCSDLPLYAGVSSACACLMHVITAMCSYVHLRVVSESSFLEVIHLFRLSQSFCPLFCIDPHTLRGGM